MFKVLKAFVVAYLAHYGQVDKAGKPYIFHPMYVARKVRGRDAKIVALLHDTEEDTCISDTYVRNIFGDKIADAVKLLSHDKKISYNDYISAIKTNSLATAVKLKDLEHNMNLNRLKNITEVDMLRVEKYRTAYKELKNEN